MSKKLRRMVSISGKTTAIPNRITTGAISSHAAGQSAIRQLRPPDSARCPTAEADDWRCEAVAEVATVSSMSIGLRRFGLDRRRHGVDRRIRRVLQEFLQLHPVLIDKVTREQVAEDELHL